MQNFNCMCSACVYILMKQLKTLTWSGMVAQSVKLKGYYTVLQGSTMDVITAYNDIHTVKKILLDTRKDPEKEFKPVLIQY